jgi:putative membrane protein
MYVWIKFLHIAFFAVWFAGLLGLPWIFGEHAGQQTAPGMSTLRRIERTVYFAVMTPAAVKLTLIVAAVAFHLYCGRILRLFIHVRVRQGRLYFRLLSQVPLALLVGIVLLASVKPI